MTRQQYVIEFTTTFKKVAKYEKIVAEQRKKCKELFEDYCREINTKVGTKKLIIRSMEMKKMHEVNDIYLDMVQKLCGIKKDFTSLQTK